MTIEVRSSSIHGLGVFATRTIRKGEWIGRYVGRRTERDGTYVYWVQDGDAWKGYEGFGRLRFLNHHDQPNSEFEGFELHALRTILPGEEITIHYGDEWENAEQPSAKAEQHFEETTRQPARKATRQ